MHLKNSIEQTGIMREKNDSLQQELVQAAVEEFPHVRVQMDASDAFGQGRNLHALVGG